MAARFFCMPAAKKAILLRVIFTEKRVVALFLLLTLSASGLLLRIAKLETSEYRSAAETQSARVLELANMRGVIYDRNGVPLVNRTAHTVIAVNPTQEAKSCLQSALSAEDYEKIRPLLETGKPFTAKCDSYDGNCKDIVSTVSYDRYAQSDVAAHLIGYTDSDGKGVCGIEKAFDELLTSCSGSFSVRYTASSAGTVLTGKGFTVINDKYDSGAGLVLTIDEHIQRVCEEVMAADGIEKGAVVVLDAGTSAILAMASAPGYDRQNLAASLNDADSPFLNRALTAYSVGSVFKPVVAAAALEQGISADTVLNCTGSVIVNGQVFHCHKLAGHGKNSMAAAMAVSCNSYFIELGGMVGAEGILRVASELGFGREIELCDTLSSESGILPDAAKIDSAPALANLSFGQGTLLASPLQLAAVYCAFANGGYYREPYLLNSILDENGDVNAEYRNEINQKVLPDSISKQIRQMLYETVADGSGSLAQPMGCEAAGKTATAETGWIQDGRDVVHTWFAGFFPYDEPEYVIVVFKEDGGSSATDCAPVFRDIADRIS